MGENTTNDVTNRSLISKIYKSSYNLTATTTTKSNQKMGKGTKWTFSQRTHTDGEQAHEKKLTILNYYKNANQNCNEVSPHANQNGHY